MAQKFQQQIESFKPYLDQAFAAAQEVEVHAETQMSSAIASGLT